MLTFLLVNGFQQSVKKGGTPKKKDVVYVAPNGEEIKTKRQLEKYLKAHPGTVSASDFDWGVPGRIIFSPCSDGPCFMWSFS